MSDAPHLLTERCGHVLVVTMNRPEAKNALSSEMLARMYDAWVELDTIGPVRSHAVSAPSRRSRRLGESSGAGTGWRRNAPMSPRWT